LKVETIWSALAEADDWALLEAKIAAIRNTGDAFAGLLGTGLTGFVARG